MEIKFQLLSQSEKLNAYISKLLPNYPKKEYVLKLPDDGLSGKIDEEKLGFSYQSLDNFIRNGEENEDFDKIIKMHKQNLHKRKIESFDSGLKNYFDKEQ